MSLLDNLIALTLTIFIVYLPCIVFSIIYFRAGIKRPLYVRIIKSSHGILLATAYSYALVASTYTSFGNYGNWLIPYNIIAVLAGISAISSLFRYIEWRYHLLYLIGLPLGLLIWLVGALTIVHDSI